MVQVDIDPLVIDSGGRWKWAVGDAALVLEALADRFGGATTARAGWFDTDGFRRRRHET